MKSAPTAWRVVLKGEAVEALVSAAREQAAAELTKVGAVDAEVMTFRVYRPAENAAGFELELCIHYRADVPLADWIKAATQDIQFAAGPGRLTLNKAPKP